MLCHFPFSLFISQTYSFPILGADFTFLMLRSQRYIVKTSDYFVVISEQLLHFNKSNQIPFKSPAVYVRKGWQFCRPTLALTSKISYCLWDTKPQSQNDKREISKVREKFKRINAQVGATHRLSSQCTPIVCTYMYTMQQTERDEKLASKKNLCQYNTSANIVIAPVGTLLETLD